MIYLLKCVIQQNHKDGIRSVDYAVQALGCTIQGNMSCAVRLCQQDKGAECLLYMKARNNDSDLIGNIIGSNGARLKPFFRIDEHLDQLLVYLHRVLLLANVVEIIQISKEDARTD